MPRISYSILRLSAVISLAAFFALLLYQFGLLIMVIWLSFTDPQTTAFMDQARREQSHASQPASIDYQWVPYTAISNHLKRAVIASEDSTFTEHRGIMWQAIREAFEYNRQQAAQGGTRRRGGSTISQQLAKNLFLSSSRSYFRKAQELILTYMIETVMSKQRILELYLNVAQWGSTTFGAQAAAQKYFGRPADKLTISQAARLAVMLPNPKRFENNPNSAYIRNRAATIQQRMRLVSIP